MLHPPAETFLEVGDSVVLLGYHDDIPELAARLGTTTGPITYRGIAIDRS